MPSAIRKRGPPAGLRIHVDPNVSTSTLGQTSSQPSLLTDASPATLSAAPSAETPLSPVVDAVSIHTDDAPAPSTQPTLPFPRAKRAGSLRNMKQLSLQLPSSAAAQQPAFSMYDQSDRASSSDVTINEPTQAPHARRSLTLSLPATPSRAAFQPPPARQPFRTRSSSIVSTTSVASLQVPHHTTGVPMTASTSSFATRAKEDDNGAPYADGPIEILPGIWLGQEENARNWPQLQARGIRWVLNVAKEVAPPYLDSQNDVAPRPAADLHNPPKSAVDERLRIRPSASTPNLAQPQSAFISRRKPGPTDQPEQPAIQPRAVPFVPPTGGPAVLYIHLPWSHGQSDLVKSGFPAAMSFVDHARRKGQGVLIHCQCGVSRSATLVIALVMRASMPHDDVEVPEDLRSVQGSMHNAYAFVKEKSKWVGPNMSLIYQLLEYERTLAPKKDAPSVTSEGTEASDEEEWSRKRLAMEREEEAEAAAAAEEDRTREARDLDRAMEERMAAKKAAPPAPLLLNPPPAPGAGTWRNRFPSRKRAGSVHSTFTSSSSVISEDPLEDDEDSEEGEANTTVMPPADIVLVSNDESSARTTTDEEASPPAKVVERFADSAPKLLPPPGKVGMKHRRSASLAIAASSLPLPPPPSAPAHKISFGGIPPPPQTATRSTFGPIPQPPLLRRPSPRGAIPPSAPAGKSGFTFPTPGSRASSIKSYSSTKRTPLPTVPSSPVAVPTLATPKTARSRPAPLRLPVTPPAPHIAIVPSSSAPQQTLFVFPPDRTHTACTPSTLTLTMMTPRVDSFEGVTPTPRKGSFGATKRPGMKRMSWLGMSAAPATPTTACSRVDAKGWVATTTRPL